ncbi:MAG: hypothetical protein ACR2O2_04710, partial [Ruegeria sp.]
MRGLTISAAVVATLGLGVGLGAWIERKDISAGPILNDAIGAISPGMAVAQESGPEISPTDVRDRPRATYYPNTEDLSPD